MALRSAAARDGRVGGAEIGKITAAAGDRLDVTGFARSGDRVGHVGLDAGILREVAVDEAFRIGARNAEPLRQSEGGDAVADAVVDHLGLVALFLGHVGGGETEDLRRGGTMDVFAAGERVEQAGIARQCRENAQFDLRIIGGEKRVVAPARDEGTADFAALRGADRNVLEIGVLRIEASRAGGKLIKCRVNAAGDRRNGGWKCVDIGGKQFAGLAMFQHLLDDGMERRERDQGRFVGGILARPVFLGSRTSASLPKRTSPSCLGDPMLKAVPAC